MSIHGKRCDKMVKEGGAILLNSVQVHDALLVSLDRSLDSDRLFMQIQIAMMSSDGPVFDLSTYTRSEIIKLRNYLNAALKE